MGSIFSIDGKFYKTMDKVADCLILNVLWLLSCIPVITIGAANSAFYYTVQKVLRKEEGSVWSTYWRTFRSNFKQATLLWIIDLVLFIVLGLDLYFAILFSGVIPAMKMFYVLIPFLMLIVSAWSIYCFAYITHIEDKLKTVLKNCFLISIGNFLKTLLIAVGYVVCLVLILFVSFGPLLMFILPVVYLWFFVCPTLEKVFGKYWNMDSAQTDEK